MKGLSEVFIYTGSTHTAVPTCKNVSILCRVICWQRLLEAAGGACTKEELMLALTCRIRA